MNIKQLVSKILGFFWTTVWQDSWFVDFVQTVYSQLVFKHFYSTLQSIYKQTSVLYRPQQVFNTPIQVLIDTQDVRSAVINLAQLTIDGTNQIGQTLIDTYSYRIISTQDTPAILTNKYINYTYSFSDFYVQDNRLITKKELQQIPDIQLSIQEIDGTPVVCYQLWGFYQTPKVLIDTFARIAGVPTQWITKYPGAVQHAWFIHQFGATEYRAKALIGRICLCPIAQQQGVVTDVIQNKVYINQHQYVCNNAQSIIVVKGSYVSKGQPLCTFENKSGSSNVLKIYKGITPPADIVPSIPIVTSTGCFTAINDQQTITQNNRLPLEGNKIQAYNDLCDKRSEDLHVPYIDLSKAIQGNKINPVSFCIQNLWHYNCIIFVVPNINMQDMQIALKCILQNTPVGVVAIAYQYENIQEPIQLNLTICQQILTYYQKSVNNNLSLQVSDGYNS